MRKPLNKYYGTRYLFTYPCKLKKTQKTLQSNLHPAHAHTDTRTHSLLHTACVCVLCRSWRWSTSTVTSAWTRPARRTARCPASETAHTRAPNSGYSATSHYRRSSDRTLHTHRHTHWHAVTRSKQLREGTAFFKFVFVFLIGLQERTDFPGEHLGRQEDGVDGTNSVTGQMVKCVWPSSEQRVKQKDSL